MRLLMAHNIFKSIRSRGPVSYGIGLAVQYSGGIKIPQTATQAIRRMKAAASRLVYRHKDSLVDGGLANNEVFGKLTSEIQPTKNALMDFINVLTSPRQDRDRDIVRTDGVDVDPRMPLLWQHIPEEPIGRMVRDIGICSDGKYRTHMAIADTQLGHDAATLVEFDALRISHGFDPLEFEPLGSSDDEGWDIIKCHVMEGSLVSIPSNVDCGIEAWSKNKLKSPRVKSFYKRQWDGRKKQVTSGFEENSMPAAPVNVTINLADAIRKGRKAEDVEKPDEDVEEDEAPKKKEEAEETATESKTTLKELDSCLRKLARVGKMPNEAKQRLALASAILEDLNGEIDTYAKQLGKASSAKDIAGMFQGNEVLEKVCKMIGKFAEEVERVKTVTGLPDGAGEHMDSLDMMVKDLVSSIEGLKTGGTDVDPKPLDGSVPTQTGKKPSQRKDDMGMDLDYSWVEPPLEVGTSAGMRIEDVENKDDHEWNVYDRNGKVNMEPMTYDEAVAAKQQIESEIGSKSHRYRIKSPADPVVMQLTKVAIREMESGNIDNAWGIMTDEFPDASSDQKLEALLDARRSLGLDSPTGKSRRVHTKSVSVDEMADYLRSFDDDEIYSEGWGLLLAAEKLREKFPESSDEDQLGAARMVLDERGLRRAGKSRTPDGRKWRPEVYDDPSMEGLEFCDTCHGNGNVICQNCDTYGTMPDGGKCPVCSGGTTRCPTCNGDGLQKGFSSSQKSDGDVCPQCEGDGSVVCEACEGTGADDDGNECETCSGSGDDVCPACDGSGEEGGIKWEEEKQYNRKSDDGFTPKGEYTYFYAGLRDGIPTWIVTDENWEPVSEHGTEEDAQRAVEMGNRTLSS
jgi:hypothetical protein